jgi:hypothetical protein
MAAEAADAAVHFAQTAALAAGRCQEALESRSADAMENAYRIGQRAEREARAAAQQAAVRAAAEIGRKDAESHAAVADRAADLSSPEGIVERVGLLVRGCRRAVASAFGAAHEAALSAWNSVRSLCMATAQAVAGWWSNLMEFARARVLR